MPVNWLNPYEQRQGQWLRGNLHAHATPFSPCAEIPLSELCAAYQRCGQHFLCVSEHMKVTVPAWDSLLLLPGVEWNSRSTYMANRALTYQHHIGVYSLDTRLLDNAVRLRAPDAMCAELTGPGTLLVANHPNWLDPEHYDQYTLHRLAPCLDGVEIYNALLELEEGEADATNRWDRLLSLGLPLLGFAGDDAHAAADVGKAWLAARAVESSPEAVFQALKNGNFYCSTGAVLSDVGRESDQLFVHVEQEARIRVIGSGGKVLLERVGLGAQWSFSDNSTDYARFHVMDRNWAQAWSQPFFRHAPRGRQ